MKRRDAWPVAGANERLQQMFADTQSYNLDRPGVYGDLSAKDVLAPITAWQQLELNRHRDPLSRRGTVRFATGFEIAADMPEVEVEAVRGRLNEYVHEQNRVRPFCGVLDAYGAHVVNLSPPSRKCPMTT